MNFKIKTLRRLNGIISLLDYIIQLNTLLLIILSAFVLYEFFHQFEEVSTIIKDSTIGFFFIFFTIFNLIFKVLLIIYMFILHIKYRPFPSVNNDELPYLTVVVPAFNEGKFIYDTLISISNSNYPLGKIQLMAFDDGSSDDTWEWINKAKLKLGDFLLAQRGFVNSGKKDVLYNCFKIAEGEIFVTIDSDSIINSDTLRNLVSPFIYDRNCGAVAGNVKIYNIRKAIIPKMLNTSFVFTFDFIKSAQSVMKSVLITPGALSAYRSEVVKLCLDDWKNQEFLGVKTDIGEDTAMTNLILKRGYNTLFQSNAIVYTNIPDKYKPLSKMFIRWERSNVRENIMLLKFAFTNFRDKNKFNTRVLLINELLTIITAIPSLVVIVGMIIFYPFLFLSSTVLSVGIFSFIPALFCSSKLGFRNSIWIFTYNLFFTFSLFWITPYSIISVKRQGWLTRSL